MAVAPDAAPQGDWSDRLYGGGRNRQQPAEQQGYAAQFRQQQQKEATQQQTRRTSALAGPAKAGRRASGGPKRTADTKPEWNSDFTDGGGWLDADQYAAEQERRAVEDAARQQPAQPAQSLVDPVCLMHYALRTRRRRRARCLACRLTCALATQAEQKRQQVEARQRAQAAAAAHAREDKEKRGACLHAMLHRAWLRRPSAEAGGCAAA
jgi:hypothetical protein